MWASVRKGYIKNLNIMFYRQLSSPCAKRIYRFLDKKRFLGNSFRMNVVMFAKKMGLMAGSTRYYPSHIKKDLTPALEELKGRVFSSFFGTINRRKQERKTYNACSLRKKSREGFEVHNARGQR